MPQFDPAYFATQLFWLAITFVALYLLMSRVALPKIGAVLEERQRKIEENLDKAAQLKAEAEAAVASYEHALAASRERARSVLHETNEKLAAEAEVRTRELNAKLGEQIKAGEARIAAAKESALANVRNVAAEVAAACVSRIAGVTVDKAKVEAAVAVALGEKQR